MKKSVVIFVWLFLLAVGTGFTQKKDNASIKIMIDGYKGDVRGPYRDLRWFCPDGSTVPANERCPQPGGLQRARYKDEVVSLGKTNHVFLGQILATTPFEDFWDEDFNQSRLKQYQLEKYVRAIDDGWILRKAQYYRGAIQAEDEEEWGIRFFMWLLADEKAITRKFYSIRQAAKDIPHQGDDNHTQNIRAVSKNISDQYPPFMNLRIKIHGQPEKEDLQFVIEFKNSHRDKLTPTLLSKFDELISDMNRLYQPVNLQNLNKYLKNIPHDSEIRKAITTYIHDHENMKTGPEKLKSTCEMIYKIRAEFLTVKQPLGRLNLLDISNTLEEIVYREITHWEPETIEQLLEKTISLVMAVAGSGNIEMWEWEELSRQMTLTSSREMYFSELYRIFENARRAVEWSSGMARAQYGEVITTYGGFESLANGFLDDRIRSSLLLPLGRNVGFIGNFIARQGSLSNQVIDVSDQNNIRGLNPGYAFGELVVQPDTEEEIIIHPDKIYIFNHPPSDLKPVAGIMTVSEGNMVSHVQLLARNLGIPNSVISLENMNELKKYSGQKVFYAVSNRGTVIVKETGKMTKQESGLFSVKSRSEDRVKVPVDQIIMKDEIINLADVSTKDSGKLCGPKAANLGQLKRMFPEHVVDGIIIPFGIFKSHMDQEIPGKDLTYWQFLNNIFTTAGNLRDNSIDEVEVEKYIFEELTVLRKAISSMKLNLAFLASLQEAFLATFGKDMGKLPVFVRSDTNMEDLKDFTGAGLNLTLFNVVEQDKIIQGIKDVWASPYTERSYRWRQKYLLNPENVYPSILIIPSVDVDYSGVMITKGIQSGNMHDLTIAFSRGAGGAVEGQVAESYLLEEKGGSVLLSPARETYYNSLPTTGGTKKNMATFEKQILNENNLRQLHEFASKLKKGMPSIHLSGPYDVELGFKSNKLWLFQVRPFVENKRAASSAYLDSITPKLPAGKKVMLDTRL